MSALWVSAANSISLVSRGAVILVSYRPLALQTCFCEIEVRAVYREAPRRGSISIYIAELRDSDSAAPSLLKQTGEHLQ